MRLRWVVAAGCLAACAPTSSGETFDRAGLLADLTNGVILPGYDAALEDAGVLGAELRAFCEAPGAAGLATVQQRWRGARSSWERTRAWGFGPVELLGTEASVNRWPTSTTALDALLAGSEPITADGVRGLGVNKLGYPALEYLLFRGDGDHARELEEFTTAPRRCELAEVLASAIETDLAAVAADWRASYRAELTSAGSGSATYPTLKAGVDQVVNQLISAVENVLRNQMAETIGLEGDATPRPDKVNSVFSDTSVEDMLAALDGLRTVYVGTTERSLAEYVASKNPAVDARVRSAFDEAQATLEALPLPWARLVTEDRATVEAAYEAVRDIKRVLGTDVVANLGVTLTFNDNDGD